MTYVAIDVNKPEKASPALFKPKDKVTFFRHRDVLAHPARDSKGVYIASNIQMKTNKNMLILYVTPGTIKFSGAAEGDNDARAIMQSISGSHPGYALEIAEFMANNLNENLGATLEFCDGSTPLLFGGECAPLQMSPNVQADGAKLTSDFEAKSTSPGPCIAHYGGTLTYAVDNEIAADDVTPSIAAGTGRYVIPDDNIAPVEITSLDDAVKGMVVTLVGSGGANVSTINSALEFILEGDVAWSSVDGSEITFEVYAADVFIERSRS